VAGYTSPRRNDTTQDIYHIDSRSRNYEIVFSYVRINCYSSLKVCHVISRYRESMILQYRDLSKGGFPCELT
jgi:hypothetical protein